ncbi:hypothetical protein BST61_g3227 [Cercospora zeina]
MSFFTPIPDILQRAEEAIDFSSTEIRVIVVPAQKCFHVHEALIYDEQAFNTYMNWLYRNKIHLDMHWPKKLLCAVAVITAKMLYAGDSAPMEQTQLCAFHEHGPEEECYRVYMGSLTGSRRAWYCTVCNDLRRVTFIIISYLSNTEHWKCFCGFVLRSNWKCLRSSVELFNKILSSAHTLTR